jgi:uncharacterized LabA/DUF88 family protein
MRYDVLREFATRDGAEASRMNLYVPYDQARAKADHGYRRGQDNFCGVLRDFGYKVTQKGTSEAVDELGTRFIHSGTTLALAIDAVQQAEHLERILLVTGNGDFADLIPVLQQKGCRVEVVSFEEPARALRELADLSISGYLVPNLLPIHGQNDREAWAQVGSKARGVCYNHSGKGYGFLRFLRETGPGLWITDSRHPDSPFDTVFFHDSQLPRNVAFHQLPSRDHIFEFEVTESDRFQDDVQAVNLKLVTGPERRAPAETGDEWERDRAPEEVEAEATNGNHAEPVDEVEDEDFGDEDVLEETDAERE